MKVTRRGLFGMLLATPAAAGSIFRAQINGRARGEWTAVSLYGLPDSPLVHDGTTGPWMGLSRRDVKSITDQVYRGKPSVWLTQEISREEVRRRYPDSPSLERR